MLLHPLPLDSIPRICCSEWHRFFPSLVGIGSFRNESRLEATFKEYREPWPVFSRFSLSGFDGSIHQTRHKMFHVFYLLQVSLGSFQGGSQGLGLGLTGFGFRGINSTVRRNWGMFMDQLGIFQMENPWQWAGGGEGAWADPRGMIGMEREDFSAIGLKLRKGQKEVFSHG